VSGTPVVVHLRRPGDLVAVDPAPLLEDDDARTVPGADEVLDELLTRRRVGRGDRLVLTLPAAGIGPDRAATETVLVTALRRWCRRRLWYPLDLLFFARLPLRRRERVLDALLTMPVEVRVREAAAEVTQRP
jgi:hypothetical protein